MPFYSGKDGFYQEKQKLYLENDFLVFSKMKKKFLLENAVLQLISNAVLVEKIVIIRDKQKLGFYPDKQKSVFPRKRNSKKRCFLVKKN